MHLFVIPWHLSTILERKSLSIAQEMGFIMALRIKDSPFLAKVGKMVMTLQLHPPLQFQVPREKITKAPSNNNHCPKIMVSFLKFHAFLVFLGPIHGILQFLHLLCVLQDFPYHSILLHFGTVACQGIGMFHCFPHIHLLQTSSLEAPVQILQLWGSTRATVT